MGGREQQPKIGQIPGGRGNNKKANKCRSICCTGHEDGFLRMMLLMMIRLLHAKVEEGRHFMVDFGWSARRQPHNIAYILDISIAKGRGASVDEVSISVVWTN